MAGKVSNSRNLQVILDKVSQTNRRFLILNLLLLAVTLIKGTQLPAYLNSRNNVVITHGTGLGGKLQNESDGVWRDIVIILFLVDFVSWIQSK